jgi:hypothetical protein
LPRLAAHYSPLVERVRGIGAPVPARVRFGQNSPEVFESHPTPVVDDAELFPLLGLSRCLMDVSTTTDLAGLDAWLALVVGDHSQTDGLRLDPDTPAALTSGDRATEDAWARGALGRLRTRCHSGP